MPTDTTFARTPSIIHSVPAWLLQEWNDSEVLARQLVGSEIPLCQRVVSHATADMGKRLRSLTTLVFCHVFGRADPEESKRLAAAVELLHTATLVHDDIIDHAELRRGKPTVSAKWTTAHAVLCGDVLFAKAMEVVGDLGIFEMSATLTSAARRMAEGEFAQLDAENVSFSEDRYLNIIDYKTGALFIGAVRSAALLNRASADMVDSCGRIGTAFGRMWQLVDDAMDLSYSEEQLGKKAFMDVAEFRSTYPIIIAHNTATSAESQQLLTLRKQAADKVIGSEEWISFVADLINKTDAIAATYQRARQEQETALQEAAKLPAGDMRDMIFRLIEWMGSRRT